MLVGLIAVLMPFARSFLSKGVIAVLGSPRLVSSMSMSDSRARSGVKVNGVNGAGVGIVRKRFDRRARDGVFKYAGVLMDSLVTLRCTPSSVRAAARDAGRMLGDSGSWFCARSRRAKAVFSK